MSESDERYVTHLEDSLEGLQDDMKGLLHASMKSAIRTNDIQLKDYLNLNYNSFVSEHYPQVHESIPALTA